MYKVFCFIFDNTVDIYGLNIDVKFTFVLYAG